MHVFAQHTVQALEIDQRFNHLVTHATSSPSLDWKLLSIPLAISLGKFYDQLLPLANI